MNKKRQEKIEAYKLLAKGYTQKETALQVGVTEKTLAN